MNAGLGLSYGEYFARYGFNFKIFFSHCGGFFLKIHGKLMSGIRMFYPADFSGSAK
jgi:hypothetical protein